jgi:hypothetical protein
LRGLELQHFVQLVRAETEYRFAADFDYRHRAKTQRNQLIARRWIIGETPLDKVYAVTRREVY